MNQVKSAISRRVLVLNRLWQPVNICGARRALSLLYREAALVVFRDNGVFATYDFEQWEEVEWDGLCDSFFVRTVSRKFRVPEIILLSHYDNMPQKQVKLTRKNVYLRDRNVCQYCGRTYRESELNLDHVIPKRLGGDTVWTNIVCSCVTCNLRKGEKNPREAGMTLFRVPKKPRWSPFNYIAFKGGAYPIWEHFLSPSDWKVQISSGKN